MTDELRDVLGAEIYDELNEIRSNTAPMDLFYSLSEDDIDEVCSVDYHMMIPMTGEEALVLIGSMFHASESDCDHCADFVAKFTTQVIGAMWAVIAQTHDLDVER